MAQTLDESTKGLTRQVSAFAAGISYESLPGPVISALKNMLLDSLGTALAGSTLGAGCDEVVAVARNMGGPPESTLLGYDVKVPAAMAGLANGALVHALNYDAIGAEVGHLGVTALVPHLAAAERRGGVSGKEFLAAAAAATEVVARLTVAIIRGGRRPSEKFLSGQLLSYFGAAAGAGRILRLTPAQMHSAFGLALMQASGTMQLVIGGDPPAKAVYGAFPNHGGVLSALLAEAGLGAEYAALEGEAGLYGMVYGGEYDGSVLSEGLGDDFYLEGVTFKPWPTSGVIHPYIEAALRVASEPQFQAGEIVKAVAKGDSHIRAWCEPLAERRNPSNAAAAGNSVPFAVATALVNGKVTPADFTPQGMLQPDVLSVAERVDYEIDDALDGTGIVEVTMGNGETHVAQVDAPLGHLSRPVSHDQLVEKFRDCAVYAAVPIALDSLEAVIGLIDELEDVPDVAKLTALLGGRT